MKTGIDINDDVTDLLKKIAISTKGSDITLTGLDVNHKTDSTTFGERIVVNIKMKFNDPSKPIKKAIESIGFKSEIKKQEEK